MKNKNIPLRLKCYLGGCFMLIKKTARRETILTLVEKLEKPDIRDDVDLKKLFHEKVI